MTAAPISDDSRRSGHPRPTRRPSDQRPRRRPRARPLSPAAGPTAAERPGRRRSRRSRASRCVAPQRTVTRSRSPSKVFAPTSFRVRRSSTAVNGASSRAAMIFAAVAGPIAGQGVELVGGRAVQVDHGPIHRRPACRPAWPDTGAARRVVAGRDADLVAVGQPRGEVERLRRSAGVDARAVAAGGLDEVADPRSARAVDRRPVARPRRRSRRRARSPVRRAPPRR